MMEGEETVSVEVPAQEVATEVQQQTMETAAVALAVANNAGEVAATASDDAQELTEEFEELEESWQETAEQLGVAISGLSSTVMAQTQVLQGMAQEQTAQAVAINALPAILEGFSTRLISLEALLLERLPAPQTANLQSGAVDDQRAAEPETSPAEALPEEKPAPPKRRIL